MVHTAHIYLSRELIVRIQHAFFVRIHEICSDDVNFEIYILIRQHFKTDTRFIFINKVEFLNLCDKNKSV